MKSKLLLYIISVSTEPRPYVVDYKIFLSGIHNIKVNPLNQSNRAFFSTLATAL
jgi:hypothetical protein